MPDVQKKFLQLMKKNLDITLGGVMVLRHLTHLIEPYGDLSALFAKLDRPGLPSLLKMKLNV